MSTGGGEQGGGGGGGAWDIEQRVPCGLWGERGGAREGVGGRQWGYSLTITPIPHPLHRSGGLRSQEWRSEVEPGKGGGGEGNVFVFHRGTQCQLEINSFSPSKVIFACDSDWHAIGK